MQYVFTATPRLVDTQYGFEGVEIGAIRITWTRCRRGVAALAAFVGLWAGAALHAVRPRHAGDRPEPRCRPDGRHPPAGGGAQRGGPGARRCADWRARRSRRSSSVTPYMGQFLIFKAFALMIIGGLGNMPGALVVGDRARADRELDRRLLRDRLAGGRGVRDHDRGAVPAARRPVQARRMRVG